jgi:hypothetical protein
MKVGATNTEALKMTLICYEQFYLFTITSLIHTCDWALYTWLSIYTSGVRTTEGCYEFGQLAFRICQAPINPLLGVLP